MPCSATTADELQPLPHSRVSYFKVCVTLAAFAPELAVKLGRRAADTPIRGLSTPPVLDPPAKFPDENA